MAGAEWQFASDGRSEAACLKGPRARLSGLSALGPPERQVLGKAFGWRNGLDGRNSD